MAEMGAVPVETVAVEEVERLAGGGKETTEKKMTREVLTTVSLLELAANNDLSGFRDAVEIDGAQVDALGSWYGRQNGSNQMVLEERTPAMIAALYGSVDVLSYILSFYRSCGADVNHRCGSDGSSALHCAAAGGSSRAAETVALLLRCGADGEALDAQGRRPADVIRVSPKLPLVKAALDRMLKGVAAAVSLDTSLATVTSTLSSPIAADPLISISPSTSPPSTSEILSKDSPPSTPSSEEILGLGDTSLPDIKNSIYSTDEFRMFSFKVRPCSRAYSHDWTECPFVHPGENARRRDPRRYHYSCVPCPDFRKGACRRGDACEYAHGVFECWLHPAQYRTRLCKDGTACARRVCFFAHLPDELRPVYPATGSGIPSVSSPCSSYMEMRSTSPPLPQSPQSVLVMGSTTYSPVGSPGGFSTTSICQSPSSPRHHPPGWMPSTAQSVPALHLPNGMQASRLQAALNARDLEIQDYQDEINYAAAIEMEEDQLVSSLEALNVSGVYNNSLTASAGSGCATPRLGRIVASHQSSAAKGRNFDDLFSPEGLSPRESPRLARTQWASQSPTGNSPLARKHRHSDLDLMAPLPLTPAVAAVLNVRRNSFSSTRDRYGNLANYLSNPPPVDATWGSPTGKPDWGMEKQGAEGRHRRSSSLVEGRMPSAAEQDYYRMQAMGTEADFGFPKSGEMSTAELEKGFGRMEQHETNHVRLPREGSIEHAMLGGWMDSHHQQLTAERVA